jgi:hypothetical protein
MAKKVYQLDGRRWTPKPGTTASFEEFKAARDLFLAASGDERLNPWKNRRVEREQAMAVMEQWTRAEPGFTPMTEAEVEAWLANMDRQAKEHHAADVRRWEAGRHCYDPYREAARLALLEQEAVREHHRRELERNADPALQRAPEFREREAARLREAIFRVEAEVLRLRSEVGDPEDVVDSEGRLPRDRRRSNLIAYDLRRQRERIELTEPLKAEDMCSECATPEAHHGWTSPASPCPAWPEWAKRIENARAILSIAVAGQQRCDDEASKEPKPKPLAVFPGGLPIAEVITRLTELQVEHPDAVVKRGRANGWEIWAADSV